MQHHNSLITMIMTHAATTMPSTHSTQRTSLCMTPTPPSSKRSWALSSISINEKKRAKMAGEGEQEGDSAVIATTPDTAPIPRNTIMKSKRAGKMALRKTSGAHIREDEMAAQAQEVKKLTP
ncbi:hypothetical protein AX14_008030 [Amanita brunnescens Koide BX004]|nr:hypothetical protein AX14_008030 [Amanita brunnescens Koide BX004]